MRSKVSMMLAIQNAMDQMDHKETNDIPVFMSWAKDADERIDSVKSYKHPIEVLDIKDCCAQLPLGTIKVQALLLGDFGCECNVIFDQIFGNAQLQQFSSTLGLIVIDSRSTLGISDVKYYVQDNKIRFSSNYNGMKCTVKLDSYYLDENNFPLINENHVQAISHYIQWRQAVRSRWKPKKRMINVDVQWMENEWHRLCADARATDEDPNTSEKKEIADLINNPLTGRGIVAPNSNYLNNY